MLLNALEFRYLGQIDQLLRVVQALLHGGQQGLPTGQGLAASVNQGQRLLQGGRTFVGECVHASALLQAFMAAAPCCTATTMF
jgi:hypothetical protein